MKPDVDKIIKSMESAYKEEQEKIKSKALEIVKNSEITICIKVSDDYDRDSLADRLEDILDDIPAIKDFTILYH